MRSNGICGLAAIAVLGMGIAAVGQVVVKGSSAEQDGALGKALDGLVQAHAGKTAMYAVQLNTGKTLSLDADLPVQTASVIKLAILYNAMVDVREGTAQWDEPITMPVGYAVGGSGMLQFFDTPMKLTLKDVLTMMVIVSDNTATDLAIDRFGVDAVDARIAGLGLKNTYLYKRIGKPAIGTMPADQAKFGLGKTTPREMAELMTDIGECHLRRASDGKSWAAMDDQDKAVCEVALHMLKSQFYRETIPRYLPDGGDQTVASKTGSLNAVRNDVAIVAGKSGPMVLSIFTYDNSDHGWTVDNEAEMTIAKLGKAIVDAWSPAGLDAKTMVPGLGLDVTPGEKTGKE